MDLKLDTGKNSRRRIVFIMALLPYFTASAQTALPVESSSVFLNPMFICLLAIILLLLVLIAVFADVVKAAANAKREDKKKNSEVLKGPGALMLLVTFLGISGSVQAQTVSPAGSIGASFYGLDGVTFFFLLGIILCELVILWILYKISMQLLGAEERRKKEAEERVKMKALVKQPSLIEKLNASVAIEEEADILLDHNYDGIRELDNNLPPWWKYGFYCTILFSFAYLIYYHSGNGGKLQLAEYEEQLAQGKRDAEEYRKKAANLVDENNATALKDISSLNSGKTIFMDNCAACHGKAGEGAVGPNLTDEYWIHKGGIKDIFKTIKYGFPEKGMKAWQQDLGAKQIHEVASFILSLRGTNPLNGKEKQGELYIEEMPNDSTLLAKPDSLKPAVPDSMARP
ncbi:MAG: cbb3-type cytochrome c oxidase N-terminal domain-containing protein [Bacteroidia bacterium]